jgi:N-methylhydantoinase B
LRFLKRELVADSGGEGEFRGGLAQELTIEILGDRAVYVSTSAERIHHPPRGYAGGQPGAAAMLCRNTGEALPPKARSVLRPHETVTVRTPGGGGFGPRSRRAPAAVVADLRHGYVTKVD